jgi:hypothetical protein
MRNAYRILVPKISIEKITWKTRIHHKTLAYTVARMVTLKDRLLSPTSFPIQFFVYSHP